MPVVQSPVFRVKATLLEHLAKRLMLLFPAFVQLLFDISATASSALGNLRGGEKAVRS